MPKIYKIFISVFVLLTVINFYAIKWNINLLHEENIVFIFSGTVGIIGILLSFVLSEWSKLRKK